MPGAWALGLGRVVVLSALGEGLRAEVDINSLTPDEASNLRVRVAPPDAYTAAGVEYNAVLPSTQVALARRSDGRPYLRLSSDRIVQEPFVDVILELNWNTGRLVREYTLLFDPPTAKGPAPAPGPVTPAVIGAAPTAVAEPRPAGPAPAPRVQEPRVAPSAPSRPPPPAVTEARKAPAPAPSAVPADGYKVRPGDTLSGIAGRSSSPGVSLDQMLVALYRANPQAFVDSNMNRLKAGSVLAVPNAEEAKATTAVEARQFIQAQSADFASYRQRLASGVTATPAEGSARQASGKVQAAVEDRKQGSVATPDKLTLSKSGAPASAPEDRLSKERESKDAATRTAELKKNVDDLQKLAAAAAASASTPSAASPAAASLSSGGSGLASTAAPASTAVATAAPAPEGSASAAPAQVAAASAPRPAPTPAAQEPGLIGSLVEDPLALSGGGLILALLAGFGVFRYLKRTKKDSGETSFLESRLQPDSFFGVSGGQHIDTREAAATGAASTSNYSLSQLDAIGDVDPVAEADVYLAYGRDLQAEEILKEALRANPDRMAIRVKLLEVYAKRRDTKGFELLARQLYDVSGGQGEDWAKAQELGAQIDPDNRLYKPGGRPDLARGPDRRPVEPLGASTMPQSVLPTPSKFGELENANAVMDSALTADLDLDLDLGVAVPDTEAPASFFESTRPMPAAAARPPADDGEFDLPLEAPQAPFGADSTAPRRDPSLEFDLSGISLDLDAPAAATAEPLEPDSQGVDFELADLADDDVDPFERKLELAEEFRQIGDTDGARELLQEVIARSTGAIQARAQRMLDSLK